MLKKRLVGVIAVKDGWAVQSFGYRRYLPLGRTECLAENLDRWGVDEIMILCLDRTRRGLGPDLGLLRRIGELGLATPVTYGGGIRTAEDAVAVIQLGADRLCLDAILHDHPERVREMSALIGAQALIASLPLSCEADGLSRHDYRDGHVAVLSAGSLHLLSEGVISEALVIDWCNEGKPGAFDIGLVGRFPVANVPLIVFGGISEVDQVSCLLDMPTVTAVGIGNFLSYREHAVQHIKARLTAQVRDWTYATEFGR